MISIKIHHTGFFIAILLFLLYILFGKIPSIYKYTYVLVYLKNMGWSKTSMQNRNLRVQAIVERITSMFLIRLWFLVTCQYNECPLELLIFIWFFCARVLSDNYCCDGERSLGYRWSATRNIFKIREFQRKTKLEIKYVPSNLV